MPKLNSSNKKVNNTLKKETQEEVITYGIEFLPKNIQDEIHKVFDNYFGLSFPKGSYRPDEDGLSFPENVHDLSLSEVSNYHSFFEAWLGYLRNKLKYIKAARIVVTNEVEQAYNEELGKLLLEKGNIDAKKAQARSGESYKALNKYLSKLEGLYELLETDSKRYEGHCMSLRAEMKLRELNNTF